MSLLPQNPTPQVAPAIPLPGKVAAALANGCHGQIGVHRSDDLRATVTANVIATHQPTGKLDMQLAGLFDGKQSFSSHLIESVDALLSHRWPITLTAPYGEQRIILIGFSCRERAVTPGRDLPEDADGGRVPIDPDHLLEITRPDRTIPLPDGLDVRLITADPADPRVLAQASASQTPGLYAIGDLDIELQVNPPIRAPHPPRAGKTRPQGVWL